MLNTTTAIHYKSDRPGLSTFGETACGSPSTHTTDDVNAVSCENCRQTVRQLVRSTSRAKGLAGLGFFVGLVYTAYLAVAALMDGRYALAVLWAVLALPGGFFAYNLVIYALATLRFLMAVVLWPFVWLFGRTSRQ